MKTLILLAAVMITTGLFGIACSIKRSIFNVMIFSFLVGSCIGTISSITGIG